MAEETYKLATPSTAWTKSRRNGNDEVPAERSAVKVIRTVRSDSATSFGSYVHAPETKSVTKISQLVYAPKPSNVTTKAVLRSMHVIKTDKTQWLKDPDKSKVPFRHNKASKNVDEKKVIAISKNIDNGEKTKGSSGLMKSLHINLGKDNTKSSESARSNENDKKMTRNESNKLNTAKTYTEICEFSENEEFNGGFTKIKQISNHGRSRDHETDVNNEIMQKKQTEFQNDAAEIQELMQRISSLENGNPKVNHKIENKKKEIQNDIAEINEMMKSFTSKSYSNDNNNVEYNNLPLDESQGATPKSVNIPLKRPATEQHIIRSKTEIATMKIAKIPPKSPNTDLLTQRTISKSAGNFPIEYLIDKQLLCRKKKSYDPDKARQYMKEQRQKRKENKEKSPIKEFKKEQIDKDEIRKRLDNLRKNTLKILDKNVKRVRKKVVKPNTPSPEKPSKPIPRRGKFSPQQKDSIRSTKITPEKKKILKPSNYGKEKTKKPFVVAGTSKKIGILRKPNPEVSSFSAALEDIKMNKENFLLTDLTKNLPRTPILSTRIVNDSDNPISAKSEYSQGFVSGRIINPKNIPPPPPLPPPPLSAHSVSKKEPDPPKKIEPEDVSLKLNVPDYKLEKKVSVSEKSIQVNPPTPLVPEKSQVPFWLKPTPVHVYPYNFIMAVRKKLEAVTNPVLYTNNDFEPKTTEYKDREKLSKDRKHSARRRLLEEVDTNERASAKESSSDSNVKRKSVSSNKYTDDFMSEGDSKQSEQQQSKSVSSAKGATKSLQNSNISKSLSEIQSNFSSISVHVPESQTISEVSAIKSEIIINKNDEELVKDKMPTKHKPGTTDDDTTISSSIFSSPEKKSKNTEKDNKYERELDVSPLSVENINNMQIKSKSRNENITMSRGDSLHAPSLKLETFPIQQQQQRQQPIVETKKDVVDFTQLLEDFNRSLSQVIEVNEQLKTTLVNPKPVTETKKIPSNTTGSIKSKPEDYSSDFEEQITTSTVTKKSTKSDLDKTDKHTSDYILEIKQSSGSNQTSTSQESNNTNKAASDEIDIKISDNTQRIQHSTNESTTSTNDYYKLPTDRIKTATPSRDSIRSEEFIDSIEEMSKLKSNSNENEEKSMEDIYNEYPTHPDNMSGAQYSKDSLEFPKENLSQKEFIDAHINMSRGDFLNLVFPKENNRPEISKPPAYPISVVTRSPAKKSQARKIFNTSIGSEIYAVFNQSDVDFSISQNISLSENSINYSSLGLYEQLLQTETSKSEHLSALLKIREKSLIDRTRGQIAWLEVRKEKYKARGLTSQISAIKKKQRAILLKMEKERDEIKRLLHSQENNGNSSTKPKQKVFRHNLPGNISDVSLRKNISTNSNTNRIIKGYEVKTSQTLEMILQKREEELKKRRTQVKRLVEWHQRLDKEEQEVLQLEQMLFNCNPQIQPQSPVDVKMHKKITEIDKSLRELQNISTRSEGSSKDSGNVRISGIKLNKLWRRLTGQKDAKFDAARKYKLSKNDLEEIYEEAKITVLRDFGRAEEMKLLLEQSNLDYTSTSVLSSNAGSNLNQNQVPKLNLNFSSNQSETDQTVSSLNKNEITLVDLNQHEEENNTHSEITSKISTAGFERISKTLESLSDSEVHKRSPKKIFSLTNENIPEINVNKQKDTSSHSIKYVQKEEVKTNSSEEKPVELKSIASIGSDQLIATRLSEKSKEPTYDESTNKKSSTSKTNSYSESEKIDTVAEISSISPDSNESSSKAKSLREKPSTDVSDKALESIPSITELSRNSPIEDIQTISRTSVIVSRLSSVEEKEQETTENSRSIQTTIPSSVQEEAETTFPTYDIQTSSTHSQSNKSVTTEENVLTYKTLETNRTISPEINSQAEDVQTENILNNNNDKFLENEFLNDTQIEEITLPKFELTLEDSRSVISEDLPSEHSQIEDSSKYSQHSNHELNTSELEKRLIDLDESLKGLNETFERALSPEKSPTSSRSRSPNKNYVDDEKENKANGQDFNIKSPIRNILVNNESTSGLMPDIINEVELRRQQQILLENDIKHIEQAVPYMFLRREIPNKPPPPYVPPAHGSPMTTIFPSEDRIKDITFRRIRELYEEITKTDTNSHIKYPSVLDENITNIYERIILDICKEWMDDVRPTLTANPETYKNSLALFNPPNRLICFQETMYKRIRKLLAMDKKGSSKEISSCYDPRKIDYVNDILIQELYEEEHKWTNFDLEEEEVKKNVVDEIFDDLVNESINEYLLLIGYNNEKETVVDVSVN